MHGEEIGKGRSGGVGERRVKRKGTVITRKKRRTSLLFNNGRDKEKSRAFHGLLLGFHILNDGTSVSGGKN